MSANADLLQRAEDILGTHLAEVEAIYREELDSANPYVRDVLAQAARFRGKRLRPILLLLTAETCGGIRRDHHVLAAVVEMIHTATLVHDDVLDEAETRRHVATVNARWNNETSVLFGDYLFTHAFHLAASLNSTTACRLIGRSTNIICEGELTQIRERGNFELDEAAYFKIIDGKTAELCSVCCKLGALYAEAEDSHIVAATQFGRSLGMAFQIADDILDLIGDESQTGKTLGSDYVKQKLTLPVIRLLQSTPEPNRAEVVDCLARADADGWRRLREQLLDSEALEDARRTALQYADDAKAELLRLPDSPSRAILAETTEFAALRRY